MFFPEFGRGVSSHFDAAKFAWKHKLGWYFSIPLILSIILTVGGFFSMWKFGKMAGDELRDYFRPLLPGNNDGIFSFLAGGIATVLGWIITFLLFLLMIKLLRYIILIVISPLLALVSQRTDEILTGKKYPFEFNQFMKDIMRGITVSMRNMLFELLIFLGTLFISWIPVLDLLCIPIIVLTGWYFLGLNMMDYTFERRRMKISEGTGFTRKHKGLAMGNGLVYSLLLYIPFLGFTFGPVLSVIAATIATVEKLED
jgi:CysZ protein